MKLLQTLVMGLAMLLSSLSFAGPVNINTADAQAIADAMNGVGLKKAQAIVEYRSKNGAFTSVDQLARVKGIGAKTLAKNRDNFILESNQTTK